MLFLYVNLASVQDLAEKNCWSGSKFQTFEYLDRNMQKVGGPELKLLVSDETYLIGERISL